MVHFDPRKDTAKMNKRKFPPSVKVYFGKDDKKLLNALHRDAKKYRMSASALAFHAIEAGLSVVQRSLSDLEEKKRVPTK